MPADPNLFLFHFQRASPRLVGALLIFSILFSMSVTAVNASTFDSSSVLTWERLADLPDPIGLKGMYAGTSRGHILLAGGSNFPVPNREGGAKTFHRSILVRPVDAPSQAAWRVAEQKLSVGQSEGSSVTTEFGVVGVGGQSTAGAMNGVFLLSYDEATASVRQQALPSLPEPCANTAAVYWQGHVYVAGGDLKGQGLAQFLRLDMAAAVARPADTQWEVLPTWPGPPRFGAVLGVLEMDGHDQFTLFGGRTKSAAPTMLADYLNDSYCFDPATQRWRGLAPMPHRALLAASVRIDATRLAVLGGSDGHDLDRMAELADRYRLPDRIVIYDARDDRWREAGTMAIGVVGAAVTKLDHGWLVAGGEYSPGLRTPQVHRVVVAGEGRQ